MKLSTRKVFIHRFLHLCSLLSTKWSTFEYVVELCLVVFIFVWGSIYCPTFSSSLSNEDRNEWTIWIIIPICICCYQYSHRPDLFIDYVNTFSVNIKTVFFINLCLELLWYLSYYFYSYNNSLNDGPLLHQGCISGSSWWRPAE